MNTGKALMGVFVGLAAGALIGILFAPVKGADVRKRLSEKEQDYEDALKEKFDEFLDSISDKFDKVKDVVSDFAEQVKLGEVKKDEKTH